MVIIIDVKDNGCIPVHTTPILKKLEHCVKLKHNAILFKSFFWTQLNSVQRQYIGFL